MIKKISFLLLSAVSVLFIIVGFRPQSAHALSINEMYDQNFKQFLAGEQSAWECAYLLNGVPGVQSCKEGTHYEAQGSRGLRLGATDTSMVFYQQTGGLFRDDKTFPIQQLEFEYRFTHAGDANDEDRFAVIYQHQYSWEPRTLLDIPIDGDTEWKRFVMDVSDFAHAEPVMNFRVRNDSDQLSTVAIRKVRLVYKTQATFTAEILDPEGNPISSGEMSVTDRNNWQELRSQKVSDEGEVTFTKLPGSRTAHRFTLEYNGEKYHFRKRIRYGWDYTYTFEIDENKGVLRVIDKEEVHVKNY
jgi:hypothetical protein